MFGFIKTTSRQTKNNLLAIVCYGKYMVSDKECCLKDEINWLTKHKNNGSDVYKAALIISNETNGSLNKTHSLVDPPVVVTCNHFDQFGSPCRQIDQNTSSQMNQMKNSKIFMACAANDSKTKKTKVEPPYVYHDKSSEVHYTMMIDSEPDDADLIFRLSGFIEWLGLYKPEVLFSQDVKSSEYLFYWIVKNIQDTGNDVLTGMYKALNTLSNHKIGGFFNLFLTDGSGVYAYSNKSVDNNAHKTVSFKINRNEHNIYSYVLRNSSENYDLDWIHLKANSLYYFPSRGALQNYLNIATPLRAETKLKKCMYWTCLSMISL